MSLLFLIYFKSRILSFIKIFSIYNNLLKVLSNFTLYKCLEFKEAIKKLSYHKSEKSFSILIISEIPIDGIKTKLDEATIVKLMAASNIFGRGFSEKKMELIMDELPDILISDETIKQKVKAVSNIKGMATKTAEAFVSKINDFVNFLKECDLEHKLYQAVKNEEIKDVSHTLFGKTIVLTGTRDKNILDFIKTIGAKQGSSITGQTNLVIAKNSEDETGKIYDAKKLGIPILSVNDFITKYMK